MGKDDVLVKDISYAMAQCSRREYSQQDISEKLRKRGLSEEEIAIVLQNLVSNKFVDNLRYAIAFTRDKSVLSGWGKRKIEYHLRTKNIEQELINQALKETDTLEAQERMIQVLENKWGELRRETDQIRTLKLHRFGMGRGYSYEQINEFLIELKNKNKN